MNEIWIIILFGAILTFICLILFKIHKIGILNHTDHSLQQQNNEMMMQFLREMRQIIIEQLNAAVMHQKHGADEISRYLISILQLNENKLEQMRQSMERNLEALNKNSNAKLDQIRAIVDDKLQETLEKKLGESFKIVSERLESVHKGLGEMQSLANGVGDLKKVLSNVKTRGIWGEMQLEAIMEQILTPAQYGKNIEVVAGSGERVEFAVRLPGKDNKFIWLPIDAKCPLTEYHRLIEMQESTDLEGIESALNNLINSIKKSAKMVATKYIKHPFTTDFAIMFLPIEGMYAEVLRHPGIIEMLQSEHRIVITGPTTLSAILNSLQMGFRTLAIEQRSSEVWKTLGTIRKEFIKFADILSKTKMKLDQATKVLGDAQVRTRVLNRHLKDIEFNPPHNDEEVANFSMSPVLEEEK